MKEMPRRGDALLIVDVQKDFLPGGRLGVPDGDAVVPALNRYIELFAEQGLPIFASRDWHPADHCSFREQGGPWPSHCVAGTEGALFAPDLRLPASVRVISKGTRREKEAYSAFEGTELESELRKLGVRRLWIGGLTTEYCVAQTAMDALQRGFEVVVLTDAVRPVDLQPGDGERALQRMREQGALLFAQEN
jgi:nicotinamidase/pyrazinamidase